MVAFLSEFVEKIPLKIHTGINKDFSINTPVLTIGTFDGVHLGHRKILKRLRDVATAIGGESVIFTFDPHPRMILYPEDHELKLLNTLEEKKELLQKEGIDHLIIYPFTKEFSRLSSVEFIRNIVVNKIGTKKLVIGYNHHFGRNREGSFEHLKEYAPVYGFEVEEIPARDVDKVEISSTKIREELTSGNVEKAARYLGYDYFITGNVIKGKERGRMLGFPTANIETGDSHKLIPADGVYAVKAEVNGTVFDGMLNIGIQPTFNGSNKAIEVNMFNFDKEIYGEKIRIHCKARLRNEYKFPNVDELKMQLEKDRQQSLQILSAG